MTNPEPLMLSGIQHFAYCRRQWALIHIEQQWAENERTVAGDINLVCIVDKIDVVPREGDVD